jgi:hypothetical protein
MIRLKIDVTKINKDYFFIGKKRQDGTQPKYLDCVLMANRDGEDDYGNTHFIAQDVGKERREAGVKGPIIGNAKVPTGAAPPAQKTAATKPVNTGDDDSGGGDDDQVPF